MTDTRRKFFQFLISYFSSEQPIFIYRSNSVKKEKISDFSNVFFTLFIQTTQRLIAIESSKPSAINEIDPGAGGGLGEEEAMHDTSAKR